MTREIKFRMFHRVDHMMCTWEQIQRHSLPFLFGYGDVETMQYTGLKDTNGVEIYEGDIVSFIDHKEPKTTERTGVVRYREWSASYVIRTEFFAYNDWINYSCEVIGNIYENPELIKRETA